MKRKPVALCLTVAALVVVTAVAVSGSGVLTTREMQVVSGGCKGECWQYAVCGTNQPCCIDPCSILTDCGKTKEKWTNYPQCETAFGGHLQCEWSGGCGDTYDCYCKDWTPTTPGHCAKKDEESEGPSGDSSPCPQ